MNRKYQIKTTFHIALPLMAAFLAQRGMQFIDTLMMGWIGPTALAAGALGMSFFVTILLFCMGVLSAIGVFVVRAKGAENHDDIESTIQHGFYLALLLSLPCMLFIWFIPKLLLVIGQEQLIVNDTALLLHGIVWGFPGLLLFFVLREFISAFSLTLIVMVVSLVSIPLTFIVNYVLIYGKYSFPALGIAGIGYGGSAIMWFMFLSLLFYSKKHAALNMHVNLRYFQFKREKLYTLLHIGIPSGLLLLLEAGMFLTTTVLMGYFSVAALAAHQIAMQCTNIAYSLPVALSMATALQISHAAGAKNTNEVKNIAYLNTCIALVTALVIAIIFTHTSHHIINLFLNNDSSDFKETRQLANSFLHIAALFLCFDAMQAVANGALRGLKDTLVPMLLSSICYWLLGIGSAYYLSMHTSLGASGIWYGLTLGLCSAAIVLVIRFSRKYTQY